MYHSVFLDMHKLNHKYNFDSAEIRFLQHICEGNCEVEKYFTERTIDNKEVKLYMTDSCYTGLDEIRQFAKTWLSRVNAKKATVHPVVQTIASGRVALETEIWFEVGENEPLKIPMAVFADLAPHGKIEGMRFYYFHKWFPGTSPYIRPVFRPTHNSPASLSLMTGVVRYYFEQLHNPYTKDALDNIAAMANENVRYGGYRPIELHQPATGADDFRTKYEYTTSIIPRDHFIRVETIVDDGVNCAVEWTSIARDSALVTGIVSQGGMASYERDDDGKFISVRICDNFRYETDIDHSKVSAENMFVY